MPIIDMPVEMLLARVKRGDPSSRLRVNDLVELMPKLGCEV